SRKIHKASIIQRSTKRQRLNEDLAPAAKVLKHARYVANSISRRLRLPYQRTGEGNKERVGRWADEAMLRHRQPTNVVSNGEKDQTATLNMPASASLRAVIPQGITEQADVGRLPDLDTLANEVMHKIEQRLTTERARRGIFN